MSQKRFHDAPTSAGGLSSEDALASLKRFGPNTLPEPSTHILFAIAARFWAPVPWMLETTVAIELALHKYPEALIVAVLLTFNAALGLLQERKASRALALLRKRLPLTARVLRDGQWQVIDASVIVPGDLIYLRMGDLVPADAMVADGHLSLDQSALTGESMPVEAGTGQRVCAGALVTRGEARARVTATGRQTFFGRTAELVSTARTVSHLQAIILRIVRYLVLLDLILVLALVVFCLHHGFPWKDVLPFALILLVASVPVALPATFTLATALGSVELARSGVLVTRLSAIEEAAAMDILFSDKTGTLTENRLSVVDFAVHGASSKQELLRHASLASDEGSQDPIDLAILQAARNAGVDTAIPRRISFTPFDPATKVCEAAAVEDSSRVDVIKGFPEAVAMRSAQPAPWQADLHRLASRGLRVIAVASKRHSDAYRLEGLIALEDPPRTDTPGFIGRLRELGVRIAMVTGDSPATAVAIANRIGMDAKLCPPEELKTSDASLLRRYNVFAGVYPEDKLRLVRMAQRGGHVCGMTGDGVNDAPALKQAEVGIAVAGATDVAKSAASLALTNPGLEGIVAGVEVSRQIYQRMLTYTLNKIIKTIEIAFFLTLGVMTTRSFVITPLLIVLLLFTNDFVTMSIATDNVSPSPLPDRWNIRTLILTAGSLSFALLLFSLGIFFTARNVFRFPLGRLQTLVFVMLVFTGQGVVYIVRERKRFWNSPPSRLMILSSTLDIAVVSFLASNGMLMHSLPLWSIVELFVAVAVFLLCMDHLKIWIFRQFGIRGKL